MVLLSVKSVGRIFLWVLLGLFLILALGLLLIQLPGVQDFARSRTIHYLEKKLGTEVQVEKIRFRLPRHYLIEGVYLEDQQGDTLLYAGTLEVGLELNHLLQKQITINTIRLLDANCQLVDQNYQFLLEAFSSPNPRPKKENRAPWSIFLKQGPLELLRTAFTYKESSLDFSASVDRLVIDPKLADLQNLFFELHSVQLEGASAKLEMQKRDSSKKDSTKRASPPTVTLKMGDIQLRELDFKLAMDQLDLSADLQLFETPDFFFEMNEQGIQFHASQAQLQEGNYAHRLHFGEIPPGIFDYRKLALSNLHLKVSDLHYDNIHISGALEDLRLKESRGASIQKAIAQVYYQPDSIHLEDLILQTGYSNIIAPLFSLKLPPEPIALQAELAPSRIDPNDLALALPLLAERKWFSDFKGRSITLKGAVAGSLDDLQIRELDLRGWGLSLLASGRLSDISKYPDLAMDINLSQFEVKEETIFTFLDTSLFLTYLRPPESIEGTAQLMGPLNDLNVDLSLTTRPQDFHLNLKGELQSLPKTNTLAYQFQLDTLVTDSAALRGLLQPPVLPAYITLPPTIELKAAGRGTLDTLWVQSQLRGRGQKPETAITFTTHIEALQNARDRQIKVQFDHLNLAAAQLKGLLPPDVLPAGIQLPDIEQMEGQFNQAGDSIHSDLQLLTSAGELDLKGSLQDSSYRVQLQLSSFDVNGLIPGDSIDLIPSGRLSELNGLISIQGQGFKPETATGTFEIDLTPTVFADQWAGPWHTSGSFHQLHLDAQSYLKENQADFSLVFSGDFQDSLPNTSLELQASFINFQFLRLSDKPFYFYGGLQEKTVYIDEEGLEGYLKLSDFTISYDAAFEKVDSLQATLLMHERENELVLSSSQVQAEIGGSFDIKTIIPRFKSALFYYLKPPSIRPLKKEQTGQQDSLHFFVNLEETQFLSSGIIPGLKEISPTRFEGNFVPDEEKLDLSWNLPHLRYQNYEVDELSLILDSSPEDLNYDLGFNKADLFGLLEVKGINWQGHLNEGVFNNQLVQTDSTGEVRLLLSLSLSNLPGDSATLVEFPDEWIINYQPWTLPEEARAIIRENSFDLENWSLSNEAKNTGLHLVAQDKDDLEIQFEDFQLEQFSKSINYRKDLFTGRLNGTIFIHELLALHPVIESNLQVDSLHIQSDKTGNLSLEFRIELPDRFEVNSRLTGPESALEISGTFDQRNIGEELDFRVSSSPLNLSILNSLFPQYLKDVKGLAEGELSVTGSPEDITTQGTLSLSDLEFRPLVNQSLYRAENQTILFSPTGINLEGNWIIRDSLDNQSAIRGGVLSNDYRSFRYNLSANLNDFIVLNTQGQHNELYYGFVRLDGNASLRGPLNRPIIVADLSTDRKSTFTYVYDQFRNSKVDRGEDVITFVDFNIEDRKALDDYTPPPSVDNSIFDINLNADISDDLEIIVITNPLAGDNFTGKAEGDLTLRMLSFSNIDLQGMLSLTEGDFLYTYTDLIRLNFELGADSELSWIGDPYNPTLSVETTYTTRANPKPILQQDPDAEDAVNPGRRKFDVLINVSGELEEPEIITDIQLADSRNSTEDQMIEDALSQIRTSQSDMNLQAFSLILFNGFISATSASFNPNLGLQDGLNSLITDNLNKLANQYIQFVDIDLGIEGDGDYGVLSNTEFTVQLEKTLLDGRLEISIDGVANTTSNDENQSQAFLDNITIEYDLDKEGDFSIRLYDKRDENEFTGGSDVKLGGALVFSKDFDRIRFLLKKKEDPKPPKQ